MEDLYRKITTRDQYGDEWFHFEPVLQEQEKIMPYAKEHISHIPAARLDIMFVEIYEALEKNGYPATAAHVVKLCAILESAARTAARDALVDWRSHPTILEVL